MPNENSHNALNLSHPNDTENRMHSSSMKNSSGLSSRHHGDRGSQYDGRSGSDDGLPLVSSDIINYTMPEGGVISNKKLSSY